MVYGLSDGLTFIGQGRVFGIPMPMIIFLGVTLVGHVVLSHTRFGKYTLVIGDNEMSARVTGLDVERHRVKVFVLSGALSGVAGLVLAGRINAGDPSGGLLLELVAITAAIIGGTNLFGGRGTVAGTVIGALILGVLQNVLNLMAVQAFFQQVAIGVVLIAAVWLDGFQSRREIG